MLWSGGVTFWVIVEGAKKFCNNMYRCCVVNKTGLRSGNLPVDERLSFDIFTRLKTCRLKILHIIILLIKGLLQFIVLYFIIQVIICLHETVKQCRDVRHDVIAENRLEGLVMAISEFHVIVVDEAEFDAIRSNSARSPGT